MCIYTAVNGHTDCIRVMLRHVTTSTHIDCTDLHGRTPLMLAVTNNYHQVVQLLVDHGAHVDAHDKHLRTALHRAVATGAEESVEMLLQARADPTMRDKLGRTAVHFAAICGHYNLMEVLLNNGGSATTPDKHGYTPVHWACYCGHDKCLENLLEKCDELSSGNAFTPLHCAVIRDSESCAELLLERMDTSDINFKDSGGRTAVHAAAFNDNIDCMQLLVSRGGATNLADNMGRTPLMMAAYFGHTNVVDLLMSRLSLPVEKLNLCHVDQQDNTALHLACLQGHEDCAMAILEKCSDEIIQMANSDQKTPLHISSKTGLVRVVQELVQRGADLNARDCDDNYPALCCAPNLHVAECLDSILQAMLGQKGIAL
jgi:serine/threonine-protein phosphatase 6 regulatory ankyrin repeat subunit A